MAAADDHRRGRRGPSPVKTAETRRRLTDSALWTFLDRGFAATRMSDVAARAGLAKGTVYLHFADKAALFEGVLRELIGDAPGQLGQPRADEPTRAFLSRAVLPVLRALHSSGRTGVVRLIASEGSRFPELATIYRKVIIDPALDAIRALSARATARGELRSDGLATHPLIMVAPAVLAILWNDVYAATPVEVGDLCEAFLDLIFGPPTRPDAGPTSAADAQAVTIGGPAP